LPEQHPLRALIPYAVGSGDISSGAIVVAKLRAFQVNASQPDHSGPITVSHNLGTTPTMYGASVLSHASAGQILHAEVGLINDSRISVRAIFSGGGVGASVSGLPMNIWCIAP